MVDQVKPVDAGTYNRSWISDWNPENEKYWSSQVNTSPAAISSGRRLRCITALLSG